MLELKLENIVAGHLLLTTDIHACDGSNQKPVHVEAR
jgi:hypothetical protein